MGDIAQRGNRLTFAKGGRAGYALGSLGSIVKKTTKKFRPGVFKKGKKTHGKDVPTMAAKGGRIGKFGGGRTNLLEELGRVEAEPSNRNRRAEISRVHGELNRGYAKGGKAYDPSKVSKAKQQPQRGRHAEGGRIGLKKGKMPWGTGPKPGTWAHVEHSIHKRKGKVAGGLVKNIPKLLKRLGKEIKDQPLPPQLQKTLDEVKKLQQLQKPRVKKAAGGWTTRVKPTLSRVHEVLGGGEKGKPHSTKEGRQASGKRLLKRTRQKALDDMHDEAWAGKDAEKGKPHSSKEGRIAGGRQNFKRWAKEVWGAKKGGKADKKWIQKAVNPKHKGYCTPMTKKTCTPARKALARTFKKKAKTGWG